MNDNQQSTQAQPQRPRTAMEHFRHQASNMKSEIAAQLPKGIDVDRFIRTVLTVVQMNPELLEADRTSLFGSCMQAAKDGLLPDGQEATIQIYNTKVKRDGQETWVKLAQYMPMMKGILKKMLNTGDVSTIDAAAVYERDTFDFERGDNPFIKHKPYLGVEDPGAIIASYVVIKLKTGEVKREVMTRRDIEKVREASKAKNGPGWTNWYDQFAIKAVIKRAAKQLPSRSEELESVIRADNEAMDFDFDRKLERVADNSRASQQAGVGKSSRLAAITQQHSQALEEGEVQFEQQETVTQINGENHE